MTVIVEGSEPVVPSVQKVGTLALLALWATEGGRHVAGLWPLIIAAPAA